MPREIDRWIWHAGGPEPEQVLIAAHVELRTGELRFGFEPKLPRTLYRNFRANGRCAGNSDGRALRLQRLNTLRVGVYGCDRFIGAGQCREGDWRRIATAADKPRVRTAAWSGHAHCRQG